MGDFLMDEFLDDADFYKSDDFENNGCIVNISRYNNNVDDDLDEIWGKPIKSKAPTSPIPCLR